MKRLVLSLILVFANLATAVERNTKPPLALRAAGANTSEYLKSITKAEKVQKVAKYKVASARPVKFKIARYEGPKPVPQRVSAPTRFDKPVGAANSSALAQFKVNSEIGPNVTVAEVKEKKPKEGLKTLLSFEYSPETSTMNDSSGMYHLDASYHFGGGRHRLRYWQRVNHTFIAPGDSPQNSGKVEALNPRFYYFYTITDPEFKEFRLQLRLGTEIGTTEQAQADGINSVSSVRLEFVKPFGDFSIGFRPYFQYYWTKYGLNSKNEPLPLIGLGHNLAMEYKLTSKLTLCVEVDTTFKMLQPAEVEAANSLSAEGTATDTVKTSLGAIVELGYAFTKMFGMRVGYSQDDKFMADGRYSLELMNVAATRYYVGLDFSF